MLVNNARNVNDALLNGIGLIQSEGIETESRNGGVIELPVPTTTVYQKPTERVMLYAERDCNPFFHFMESMWMLAGRNDTEFVTRYAKQIALYSTDGETLNGAYGYRWRNHFGYDQLSVAIDRLKNYPGDRRTVIQIWDGSEDLVKHNEEKDHPCNTAMYLWVRDGKLNMTVTNRSNDMLWGAYGANAVHFSFVQEYIAAMLDCEVGTYYQMSNNLHVYTDFGPWEKVKDLGQLRCPYVIEGVYPRRLVNDKNRFLREVGAFCEGETTGFKNSFIQEVAVPMQEVHATFKTGDYEKAIVDAHHDIHAADWKRACVEWLGRRIENRKHSLSQ